MLSLILRTSGDRLSRRSREIMTKTRVDQAAVAVDVKTLVGGRQRSKTHGYVLR